MRGWVGVNLGTGRIFSGYFTVYNIDTLRSFIVVVLVENDRPLWGFSPWCPS
jgi:hypothetical protein